MKGALCAKADAEIFFPELPLNHHADSKVTRGEIDKGLKALAMCMNCPVLEECTEYTFKSMDSIKYGISAGLTPIEKRAMINYSNSDLAPNLWKFIRSEATALGIATPDQTKREKPKPFYRIEDDTQEIHLNGE